MALRALAVPGSFSGVSATTWLHKRLLDSLWTNRCTTACSGSRMLLQAMLLQAVHPEGGRFGVVPCHALQTSTLKAAQSAPWWRMRLWSQSWPTTLHRLGITAHTQ
jgi:hypothetical protein